MTDYSELVKALRYCAESGDFNCNKDCPMYPNYPKCLTKMDMDAAAAIEDMSAQLAYKDYLIQQQMYEIQRLMADVKRQQEKMFEMAKKLPKRGKWINSKERMRPDMCSVCGCVYEADRFMDKIAWNYCPNCGAKMEVQE